MTQVVYLVHSGAESGAELSLATSLAHWPEDEPRPVVLVAEDGPVVARFAAADADVRVRATSRSLVGLRRGSAGGRRLLAAVGGLRDAARTTARDLADAGADVVVATSLKSLAYGWPAARRRRLPVVWSLHDRVAGDYFPRWVVPLLRYVAPRLVSGIIVNSRSTLSTIRPGRTPVLVAYPAMELPDVDVDVDADAERPAPPLRRVGILGRLAHWKGQDVFLEAFARAFADRPEVEAVVIGGALFGEDDYQRELVELADTPPLRGLVTFTGHVTDPWPELVGLDVLVHASRTPEPFGQVVVQGMWAGCAVVATTPGGPSEVITPGRDGMLVPCDDVPALAAALRHLGQDDEGRVALGRAARATAARYAIERAAPARATWLADVAARRVAPSSVRLTVTREVP